MCYSIHANFICLGARPSKRLAAEVDDEKRVRKEKKRKHTKIPVPASDVITLTDTENADDIYDDPPQRPRLKTSQSAKRTSRPLTSGTQSPTNAQTVKATVVPAVASKPATPVSQSMSISRYLHNIDPVNPAPTVAVQTPPPATDIANATAPRLPSNAASARESRPPSPRQEPTPARPSTTNVEAPVAAVLPTPVPATSEVCS